MEFGDGAPLEDGPARARDSREQLLKAARERILILDGAMGTEVQGLGLEERHFRGERFIGCECHLQGNNDLLTLTQPQAIEDIHFAYAMAGADILETNTFSATRIAQAAKAVPVKRALLFLEIVMLLIVLRFRRSLLIHYHGEIFCHPKSLVY